jgi:hypothetical protein
MVGLLEEGFSQELRRRMVAGSPKSPGNRAIESFPPLKASSNDSRQNRPSRLLERLQLKTYRMYKSITAVKYMNP